MVFCCNSIISSYNQRFLEYNVDLPMHVPIIHYYVGVSVYRLNCIASIAAFGLNLSLKYLKRRYAIQLLYSHLCRVPAGGR